MTIRRGTPWGAPVPVDPDRPSLGSDAALHDWAVRHRLEGLPVPPVTLTGGDLARTCGGGRGHTHHGSGASVMATRVTLDLVRVTHDHGITWMVAHLVARRRSPAGWWRGPAVVAMNAQFLGHYDVAPRSHPNDGKVDVLQIDPTMTPRVRWQARRRARLGTHVPHPQISVRQTASWQAEFAEPLTLWVDGTTEQPTAMLQLDVEPDAFEVDVV